MSHMTHRSGEADRRQSEDRLSSHFKQLLSNQVNQIVSRIDASRGPDIVTEVSTRLEKQIKATLTSLVQQEIKRSSVVLYESFHHAD